MNNRPAHTEHAMQACIEACSSCHQVCLQTAMNQCLKTGGKHMDAEHFSLLISCAETVPNIAGKWLAPITKL